MVDRENVEDLAIVCRFRKPETREATTDVLVPARETVQAMWMEFPAGHAVPAHRHLPQERRFVETQEILYVAAGRVAVDLYRTDDSWAARVVLHDGDLIVLLRGGHAVKALTRSRILEFKTGPYFGRELDKIAIPTDVETERRAG